MKQFIMTAALVATSLTATFAQKAEVTESAQSMNAGSQNAFSVKLPGTETKDVERAWEKYVKEFGGKTKKDKKTGEFLSNNCAIKKLNGDNTIDISARVSPEGKTDNTLTVWFNLGGAYLSSAAHADKVPFAKEMLMGFANSVSRTMIEDNLKEEQKKLKKEEDKLKDLEKDKKGLDSDIESYKKKIKKAEDDIKKAEDDIKKNAETQKIQAAAIGTQKEVVEVVKKKLDNLK